MIDCGESKDVVLKLCALDYSTDQSAEVTERPVWDRIPLGLEAAFAYGGFLKLVVLQPEDSLVDELTFEAIPGHYKLIASMRSAERENWLWEWWEPGDEGFKGFVRFGDDDWDARKVCTDLNVAYGFFKELFETGTLVEGLKLMHSWFYRRP